MCVECNYVIYAVHITILLQCCLVMHRYDILPIFQLTDIAFPIFAKTDGQSDINIISAIGITMSTSLIIPKYFLTKN